LSGFTSKTPGTERGVVEPTPTFSTCFGAPFMPRRPEVYGKLLQEKIAKTGATCWLVNTGWSGGAFGTGRRMPIKATRALLSAALDGSLNKVKFRKDANFGFDVFSVITINTDRVIRAILGQISLVGEWGIILAHSLE
jgi:phosphoenolpyruvate carboxykinase (ATP)